MPRILDRVAQTRSGELFSLLALLIVLGSALTAESLGLTLAVGAFLAGVAASGSPYAHHLFSEVVPLRGVLLGIFFTARDQKTAEIDNAGRLHLPNNGTDCLYDHANSQ